MLHKINKEPLDCSDHSVSYTPEALLDIAYFTSPLGIVICYFSPEGHLTQCRPIEMDEAPSQLEKCLQQSLSKHPTLANALWTCTPPPAEYAPVMPHVRWAPHFWELLAQVPFGTTLSYGELAQLNGLNKNQSRAIGRLLGTNPIIILYPCHRIIRSNGELGGYRWGLELKEALLQYEASNSGLG